MSRGTFEEKMHNGLFEYYCNDDEITKLNTVSMVVCGYIRLNIKYYIPNDIKILIQQLYGIKYKIYYNEPNNDDFDYVVHLLSPINTLGFYRLQRQVNVIFQFSNESAEDNFMLLSRIIQINNIKITNKDDTKYISKTIADLKQNAPSFMVLRCRKEFIIKGFHMHFEASNKDTDIVFPYYKFNIETFHGILSNNMEIMDIYANSKHGVSIHIFMKTEMNTDIQTIINELTNDISSIDARLNCIFINKIFNTRLCTTPYKYTTHNSMIQMPLFRLTLHCNTTYNDKKLWCFMLFHYHKWKEIKESKKSFRSMSIQELSKYGHILLKKDGYHNRDPGFIRSFTHDERELLRKFPKYYKYSIWKIWNIYHMKPYVKIRLT